MICHLLLQINNAWINRYEMGEEALTRSSRENSLVEPYKASSPGSHTGSQRGNNFTNYYHLIKISQRNEKFINRWGYINCGLAKTHLN